ncbi:hypothetical protein M413DRAFT_41449, partial [Hebeloma cylindrosporum]
LFAYVDDVFTFDLASEVSWYEPYKKFMPTKQAKLLSLWDELGVPHSESKQVSGPVLTIIGFVVDVNAMTISIPPDSLRDLIAALSEMAVPGHRPRLCDLQELAGWVNWALSVYPLLRPCLSAVYEKMSKKSQKRRELYVNSRICRELRWAISHLRTASPVFMLNSIDWDLPQADY